MQRGLPAFGVLKLRHGARKAGGAKAESGPATDGVGRVRSDPAAAQRRTACSEDSSSGVLKLRHGAWKAGGADWGLLPLGAPGPSEAEQALPDWQGKLTLTGHNLLQPSALKRPEEACRLEGGIRGADSSCGRACGEAAPDQRRQACSEDSPPGVLKLRHGAWKADGAEAEAGPATEGLGEGPW